MENKDDKNACYIDGQNLYYSFVKTLDIEMDWKRFRIFLKEKHKIDDAYYFVGYFEDNMKLYIELQLAGFVLVFKPLTKNENGIKGNVDGDLIAFASRFSKKYSQNSLITNDGDYHRLVEFLLEEKKLHAVFATRREHSSWLLRRKAKSKMLFLEDFRNLFETKKKNTP